MGRDSLARFSHRVMGTRGMLRLIALSSHGDTRDIRLQRSRACTYLVYPAKASSPPSPESATVTCCRAIAQTSAVGTCDESAKGSSYISGNFGMTARVSAGVRYTSVW